MTATFLFAYIVGALAVSYALMVWFHTGFALHLVDVLQGLGIKAEWWDTYDEVEPATKGQLDDYLVSKLGYLPMWLELLCCPVCLSFHLSYILAIAMCLCTNLSWWLVPAAVAGWPALSNIILKHVSSK